MEGDQVDGALNLSLAATKLRPPTLPEALVQRARLDEILDTGVDANARLVLVSAPAGSGKSTLIASWLAGRTEASAWLQAEESDDDPGRFWAYLVEAISEVLPSVRAAVKPAVLASNGDDDMVISTLITALAESASPLVIVVDDYHLITNDVIHQGMERLVELCPPQVTVVVSTRFDPPFRLGRLRVRGHLLEVRSDGLRFEPAEAATLLGGGAGSLGTDEIELLSGRTEGWAAGLVLARLSLAQVSGPRRGRRRVSRGRSARCRLLERRVSCRGEPRPSPPIAHHLDPRADDWAIGRRPCGFSRRHDVAEPDGIREPARHRAGSHR